MQESLLSAKEVAETLKVGKRTIYRLIQDGELPSLLIGSSIRVPQDSLSEWIRLKTINVVAQQEQFPDKKGEE